MSESVQSPWKTLQQILPVSPSEGKIAQELLAETLVHGAVRRTCLEMLSLPDAVIVAYYAALADLRPAISPAASRGDSGWMTYADFCFINVRATGLGEQPGSFIQAAKLLPVIRANAIHLGPFTRYDFGVIYAVQSLRSLATILIDQRLLSAGFDGDEQLHAFVDAAHRLGKAVGFDLEPHTAQFSIPVVEHPDCFRWIELGEDRNTLAGGITMEESLSLEHQTRIAEKVRQLTISGLHAAGFKTFETESGDSIEIIHKKEAAYGALIETLIANGLWTIPSQIWDGDGVPAFAGYHQEGGYPRFDYRSRDGRDGAEYAYHILTPFAFHSGLRPNKAPLRSCTPQLNQSALDLFCSVFSYWRDEFDFDFIRYDSVDHIFDSAWLYHPEYPASDRPASAVLQACITASRTEDKPWIGNFAERMGNEIEEYSKLGFDLILGTDMLERINHGLIEKTFWLQDRHNRLNRERITRAAVTFSVDTHDTGNPFLWGDSLIKIMGPERMRLRHFISRFCSAGVNRRPKYEVMGVQDLSHGLYPANISEQNLTWVGDTEYTRHYHLLEDIYDYYRPVLNQGEIYQRYVDDEVAWWVIQSGRTLLIPLVALEHDTPIPGHAALDLRVWGDPRSGLLYDFQNREPEQVQLGTVFSLNLPPLGFRLLVIEL